LWQRQTGGMMQNAGWQKSQSQGFLPKKKPKKSRSFVLIAQLGTYV
jgi:hypothetical protein